MITSFVMNDLATHIYILPIPMMTSQLRKVCTTDQLLSTFSENIDQVQTAFSENTDQHLKMS